MNQDLISPFIAEKLGYYVYLYINPLNGQIFYVGKGEGSRCLAHLHDQAESKKIQPQDLIKFSSSGSHS